MKKAILLCVVLVLTLCPLAKAELDLSGYTDAELTELIAQIQLELHNRHIHAEPADLSDFIYAGNGRIIRINGYVGSAANVVIPSQIDGQPVASIMDEAFFRNDEIKTIIIPDTVETIGENVLSQCDSLKSIELGNSVREIGSSAFSYDYKLEGILSLPKSIQKIDCFAFDFTSLKGVIINSNLEAGHDAYAPFQYMDELQFVYIRNGLSPILHGEIFASCDSLRIAIIPDSVKSLPQGAFSGCNLLTIYTPKGSAAERFAKANSIAVNTDDYEALEAEYAAKYPAM